MAQKTSVQHKKFMRNQSLGLDSVCLECGEFLARSKGPYTGKVTCEECGAINYFEDSNKPVRAVQIKKAS